MKEVVLANRGLVILVRRHGLRKSPLWPRWWLLETKRRVGHTRYHRRPVDNVHHHKVASSHTREWALILDSGIPR